MDLKKQGRIAVLLLVIGGSVIGGCAPKEETPTSTPSVPSAYHTPDSYKTTSGSTTTNPNPYTTPGAGAPGGGAAAPGKSAPAPYRTPGT